MKIVRLKFFANPITLDRAGAAARNISIDLSGFLIKLSKLTTIFKESAEPMERHFQSCLYFPHRCSRTSGSNAPAARPDRPPALRRLSTGLLLALATACGSSHADDTRYIRDWIAVPLLAGGTADSKTIHNGLVSGTAVTLLETNESSGYSRVRIREGLEGWLATRYLTDEPIARVQLDKANAELEELRKLKAQLTELPADMRAATQQLIDARSENTRLQHELSDSRRTPSEAAEISAENTRLQARNAELQQQQLALETEIRLLRSDQEHTQFRDGALAVIGGMLLVLVVRRLWPKKRSEWS